MRLRPATLAEARDDPRIAVQLAELTRILVPWRPANETVRPTRGVCDGSRGTGRSTDRQYELVTGHE